MRRRLRLVVALAAVALASAACATPTPDERALLDEMAAAIDSRAWPIDSPDLDDRTLADEDYEADDPWIAPGTEPAPDPGRLGARPEVEQVRCPFSRDGLTRARCGRIELPGRGADPDFTVEISFVRFDAIASAEDKQPDPVVYLHGGPGGAILDDADYWYDSIVAPHIGRRDVILFDQRGAGRSSALPTCRETFQSSDRFYTEPVAHELLRDDYLADLEACGQRLAERDDFDPTAFTSAANAQDVVDLMWALGVETYNIHGSSYGTRVAQTLMRDAPEGIRSLVLAGAYPVEANLMGSVPVSLESSLDAVFAGCAASPRCDEALPFPWLTLEALVASLDAAPQPVDVALTADSTVTLAFDGTDLLNGLHSLLYNGFHAATVPDLLIDWLDGNVRRIERLARVSLFDHSDVAVFILIQCADEGPFTTAELLQRPLDHGFLRAVDLAPSLNGLDATTICAGWPTGPTDPIENEPVSWDAPTLVLAGAVDPITPPEWARSMASRLPRARLVEFANLAHDSDEGWCATGLIADFIDQPDVPFDTDCADNQRHLVVDDNADRFRDPLSFVERSRDFNNDGEFVSFEAPNWFTDWIDDSQVLWRAHDQLDATALVLMPPDSNYDLVEHLAFNGAIPDWRDTSTEVPDWRRSLMETVAGTLIRYTNEFSGVEVALVLEPGEPDDLERTVLIPVAESIGSAA